MDFFKFFRLQLILLCFTSLSFGQIESGKVNKQEKSKEKEKKTKKDTAYLYTPSTMLYFGGGVGQGFRSLKENDGYFSEPLGERANETPLTVGSFTIGMKAKLVNKLYLDFGASYSRYGEAYKFSAADSSYKYKSTYTYFAIPIKLQYVTGKKLKFIAGIGLQPQIFVSYKRENSWKTTENVEGKETIKDHDNFNFFTVAALANVGVEWQFGKRSSLYVLPEFRTQLNSTLDKQAPYVHKGLFYGVQIGLSFALD